MTSPSQPASVPNGEPVHRWAAFRQTMYLVLSLGLAGAALVFLLWSPFGSHPPDHKNESEPACYVRVAGPELIWIRPDSLLGKKLQHVEAAVRELQSPKLTVTGSVVALTPARARTQPMPAGLRDSTELATTYGDLLKARARRIVLPRTRSSSTIKEARQGRA